MDPKPRTCLAWSLSVASQGHRILLGKWGGVEDDRNVGKVLLFRTRKQAREAAKTCRTVARVERVRITIEAATAAEKPDA